MPALNFARARNFSTRHEYRNGVLRFVTLRPFEQLALYPFTREASHLRLRTSDFVPHGNDGQVALRKGLGYYYHESARLTQLNLLARGNGLTTDDIMVRNTPIPTTIDPDLLHQLQVPPPLLLPAGLLESNFFLLPGQEDELRALISEVQLWMALCDAWEARVDERAEELRELGHLCPWSRVTLRDSDYSGTDITVIPVYKRP